MASIQTIQATDLITNSRADINQNFDNLNNDKIETSYLDTDTTLSANSDTKIPTQKAVKAYVDAGGNPDASTTQKGIVEEATQAELTAGTTTGGTGARLFINPVHTTSTSAGVADSGKIPRLNASGQIDSTMVTSSVPVQDILLKATANTPISFRITSNPTGTVVYVGYQDSGSTTTAYIVRFARDAGTGNYMQTHSTTLTVTANGLYGLAVLGNYLYVKASISATGALRRYDAADLSNVTTMTISGTNDLLNSYPVWADGTNILTYSSPDTYRIYTISGTTATAGSTRSYTSSGLSYGAISNSTHVYLGDTINFAGSANIRKYAIAGGAVINTTTPIIYATTYPNGSPSNGSTEFFLAGTNALGIAFVYSLCSDSAKVAIMMHLQAITLP